MKKLISLFIITTLFAGNLEVDGGLSVTGTIDANGQPITNVGTPTSLTDAINGNVLQNFKSEKINLPSVFTTKKNGGVKTVFIYNNKEYALISSFKNECYYASIVLLNSGRELFKTTKLKI